MHWNDIDPAGHNFKIEYAAADTEAYTLVDGARISTNALHALAGEKETADWWREHTTVDVYAWLITDGRKTACFETWEDFAQFCADHRIGVVWWYNAKYDFSHIDYALLSTGWQLNDGGRLLDRQYSSLHGRQGQRYCMKVAKAYKSASRHVYTHMTRHYDLCNIFGGGLERNLQAFNVVDFDGKPVRKLEMDYQGDDAATMRAYMDNDVIGLFHLVRIADDFLAGLWGYRLAAAKPDVMTAGGLAKRVLLSYYNGGSTKHSENIKEFQRWHKLTVDLDGYYRGYGLYRGGITLVNEAYQNKALACPIYKYDINSMYPFQMSRMPDPVGWPHVLPLEKWEALPHKEKYVSAYLIDDAFGTVHDGMLPVFYNLTANKYTATLEINENANPYLFFIDEWEELTRWYDVNYHVKEVIFWDAAPAHGIHQFVKDNYDMKREAKRTKLTTNLIIVLVSNLL